MDILKELETNAITTFVSLIDNTDIFHRIIAEIKRVNDSMPHATGKEKRARVLADAAIIFDDLIEPIAENTLRLLLELGVMYLKAQVK